MRPTLFTLHLGGRALDVHGYGLLIALGVVAGVLVAVRQARRVGLDTAAVLDLAFWALVAGIVGARLLYVAMHAADYARLCAGSGLPRPAGRWLADCAAPLAIWQGGLVFYGGALAAAGAVLWLAWRRRWPVGEVADLLAPSVALGHVFGRIGCFLVGCCYGKVCSLGVHFPGTSVAFRELSRRGLLPAGSTITPALAPTQLFEAAGELVIFVGLVCWRQRRPFVGAVALAYAFAYAMLRTIVEAFRGDGARGYLFELALPGLARALGLPPNEPLFLSTAQALSVGMAALAALAYRHMRRRATPEVGADAKARKAG